MAFRASSTAGDSSGTTLVIAYPAGMAANDICTLLFYGEATLGLTLSFDKGTWTKDTAASGSQLGDATDFETYVYTSRIGAESGNLTISWGGATIWRAAWMAAHSGRITSGAPQDATSTYNKASAAGVTATMLAVSPANANADLVAYESNVGGSLHSTWTAGLTERVDFGGQGMATQDAVSAGTTGNKTVTVVSNWWSAGLLALKDSAAGGATNIPIALVGYGGGFVGKSRGWAG